MTHGVLNLPRNPVLDWTFGHSLINCHVEHHLFPFLSDHMCLKVGDKPCGIVDVGPVLCLHGRVVVSRRSSLWFPSTWLRSSFRTRRTRTSPA